MKTKKVGFTSVDQYIAACPPQSQERLQKIRETIKNLAPAATEKISYQIAAFELNGRNLIYFAGWKSHISIYPIPPGDETFNEEIAPYMDGKGTLKFPLDKPLPLRLVKKIVKLHIKAHAQRAKSYK
jgi:uncharacterized protein YdhG (YjbR/CyaY superfamily)